MKGFNVAYLGEYYANVWSIFLIEKLENNLLIESLSFECAFSLERPPCYSLLLKKGFEPPEELETDARTAKSAFSLFGSDMHKKGPRYVIDDS